jgi:serine O-acetyltransferase
MNLSERAFLFSRVPLVGGLFYAILKGLGVEFPRCVLVGRGVSLPHGAVGLVVHESTCIGERVTLFQGVTLGRADQYNKDGKSGGICIGDDVVICAGAKVLFKSGETLSIGNGSIIGANAVLLNSVGSREIWAGIPARLVRRRG